MNELLNQMLDKKWWIYLSVGQYAKYQSKNLHILHKDGHKEMLLCMLCESKYYTILINHIYNQVYKLMM